ncbi:putative sensor histidine kinase TcrY [Clavibacter michiganensis subsp. michiganensis]|nr:putative sensor histidine kinase TcrY [Clavibacter michiganensis subsp. michiganensis]
MHDYVSEKWNNVSLRTKITSVTVLLLLLGLLVSGAGTMYLLRQQMVSQLDAQLRVTITQLPKVLNTDASMPDTFTQDDVATADPAWFVVLLDAQGDVLADNWTGDSAEHPRVFGLDLARASQINNEIVVFSDNSGKKAWHGIVRVSQNASPDAMEYSTLVVARPLEQVDDLVATYIVIFASFGLAVVVLGAAVTRMLVTSTFGPLREVERTAAAIAGGDFSQRLGGATPNTEVGRLNRSLNMMLSRIDRAFADRAKTIDQMRRFVGDASHELRTPLVSVRGYAELYRMGALQTPEDVSQAMERIEKEAIRMGGLVEDLLELARLDETKPLQLAPVDLYPIARDAALDAMASSQTRTVTALPPVLVNPVGPVLDADGLEPTQDLSPDAQRGTATTSGNDATGPIAFAGATLSRFRARRSRRPGETATDALSPPAPATTTCASPPRASRWSPRRRTRSGRWSPTSSATRCASPPPAARSSWPPSSTRPHGKRASRSATTGTACRHRSARRSSSASGAPTRRAPGRPAAAGSVSPSCPPSSRRTAAASTSSRPRAAARPSA